LLTHMIKIIEERNRLKEKLNRMHDCTIIARNALIEIGNLLEPERA